MAFPSDSARTKNWNTEILTDADLEGQLDILHAYFVASLNSTTGHSHDGTSNQGPKINISNLTVSSQATGDIYYASSSTANARLAIGTAGKFLQVNSGATAPEWDTLVVADMPAGTVLQVKRGGSVAVDTTATAIPFDDSIPQNSEGEEEYSVDITPNSATNKLRIDVSGFVEGSVANEHVCLALFQDSTAGALACGFHSVGGSGEINPISFTHYMDAGTTSSTTFKVNYGTSSGTATINGAGGNRKGGGVLVSSIVVTEIKV